jgi:hypothetical protein
MNESGSALTRFDIPNGELRGTHLTLHPNCVVHRGESQLETLPLGTVTSVRVTYQRNASLLGWGAALFVVALVMLALAGPVAALAAAASADLAPQANHGVASALYGFFRILEALANALPLGALVAVLGGGALAGFGWLGNTVLTLTFAGGERSYPVRGRNTRLLDFSEAVSERLMQVKR